MAPTFADVVPVKQLTSHQYTLNLEDEWCIGTGTYTPCLLLCNLAVQFANTRQSLMAAT